MSIVIDGTTYYPAEVSPAELKRHKQLLKEEAVKYEEWCRKLDEDFNVYYD